MPCYGGYGSRPRHTPPRPQPLPRVRVLLGLASFDNEVDDHAGDVLAGGLLDAFQAGRGIHLHDHRPVIGAQDVDAGHIETHGGGGAHRCRTFLRGDPDQFGGAAAVQVGAELALLGAAHHGGNHLFANDETADVGAAGLLDELLHQDVGLEAHERLDHAFGRLLGLRQHHADALGAFQQLDHDRRAADHLDQILDIVRRMGEAAHRQTDALARQQLQRAQLVARTCDGDRLIEREHAHHFELAHHRRAVEGDRSADARDHGIEAGQILATVMDLRLVRGDVHVAAQGIDHLHLMPVLLGGLDQAPRGIQGSFARQRWQSSLMNSSAGSLPLAGNVSCWGNTLVSVHGI